MSLETVADASEGTAILSRVLTAHASRFTSESVGPAAFQVWIGVQANCLLNHHADPAFHAATASRASRWQLQVLASALRSHKAALPDDRTVIGHQHPLPSGGSTGSHR
jgi:hypothetical protein